MQRCNGFTFLITLKMRTNWAKMDVKLFYHFTVILCITSTQIYTSIVNLFGGRQVARERETSIIVVVVVVVVVAVFIFALS